MRNRPQPRQLGLIDREMGTRGTFQALFIQDAFRRRGRQRFGLDTPGKRTKDELVLGPSCNRRQYIRPSSSSEHIPSLGANATRLRAGARPTARKDMAV